MTVRTRVSPMRKLSRVGLGVALAVSIPMAGAVAADVDDEASLCDAITIDQLHALGPLRFEPPEFSSPTLCAFGPADESDAYTLYLTISGFSIDDMRTAIEAGAEPGFTEIMVGDRPAIMSNGDLHVGLDQGLLSIGVEPDDAGGIDPVRYIVDIAEVVVPVLAAAPASDAAGEVTVASPPDIEGIDWRGQNVTTGQDFMEDEAQAALWQPLLDATGAAPTQLVLLNVRAFDDADERLGQYDAIRVVGSDPGTFRSALTDWLRAAAGGDDVAFEDRSLGGKDVVSFSVGGELMGYLYFSGDTAHALTLPEEHAARILEVLP